MPNWCFNNLTLEGLATDLKAFDEKFRTPHVYFEQIFLHSNDGKARLEELKKTVAESDIVYADDKNTAYVKQTSENVHSFNNFIPMPESEALNWYGWRNENWNTKWDASDLDADIHDIEHGNISYGFCTAWSPPTPVIQAMVKAFPGITFEWTYEEEGCEYAGIVKFSDGECTSDVNTDNQEGSFRDFMHEHMGRDYYKCANPDCGVLIDECELSDNDDTCSDCGGDKIYGYDHKTLLEFNKTEEVI